MVKMKLRTKLIFFIGAFAIAVNFGCSSNLSGETTGQVTRVVLDRDRKTTTRKTSSNKKKKKKTTISTETEIDYRYSVGGRTFEGFSEKEGDVQHDFPTGATVVVCYDPSNPEESEVFAAGAKCE